MQYTCWLITGPTYALQCMKVIVLHSITTCCGHSCGHFQGGKNKNTFTLMKCQNQSTVKKSYNFG